VTYSLAELLSQIGAEFDDCKPINARELSPGHYLLVVAAEFDSDFRLLSEARAKITGWQDGSDFAYYSGH
jgi:hypothetical protein